MISNAVQYDSDISAYTVEKTMDMENRIKAMRELHAAKRKTSLQVNVTDSCFLFLENRHAAHADLTDLTAE